MSARPGCEHASDAGAYLLRALSDDEHAQFAGHLASCTACRREVDQLQVVVDTLPIAAPQYAPPVELRDRIMHIVDAEAQLLRASGPEADRVPAEPEAAPRRSWGWGSGLILRPVAAGAVATVLLAVGVVGGVTLGGAGDNPPPTRSLAAQVAAPGATAVVSVQDGRAALHVKNLPSPPFARVYQVWIKRGNAITPTHSLFNVRKSDGSSVVPIEEPVRPGDEILVTDEQNGGSQKPTGEQLITAPIT